MELVENCVEKAKGAQMLAWLYDEDRWPSGCGGGLVTKEKKYRRRYLLFTQTPYTAGELASDPAVDLKKSAIDARDLSQKDRYGIRQDRACHLHRRAAVFL